MKTQTVCAKRLNVSTFNSAVEHNKCSDIAN